jgi:signal transduction histidine kinase
MARRLLGPVGGPIVFFLVAALVFGGLGWVTYAALNVEQAQRSAHARAEIGNNLRVALWRLDGRMLPALGVEDSRPFYHYAPPDPAATPLLAAKLPEWMKLHFQLSESEGWESPQVLDQADLAERVRQAWPADVPLRNMNGARVEFLKTDLKAKFPAEATCQLFAQREQAIPADSLPFAAPLFVGEANPPAQPEPSTAPLPQPASVSNPTPAAPTVSMPLSGLPGITPDPNDTFRMLGFEFCLRNDQHLANQQSLGNSPPNGQLVQNSVNGQKKDSGNSIPGRGGRGQKDMENDKSWLDYATRAGTAARGIQDAKQAADDPRTPYSQSPTFPVDPKNVGNSTYGPQTMLPNLRNDGNTLPTQQAGNTTGTLNPLQPMPPGSTPGRAGLPGPPSPIAPVSVPGGPAPGFPGPPAPTGVAGPAGAPGMSGGGVGGGGFGGHPLQFDKDNKDKAARDLALMKSEKDTAALGGLLTETAKLAAKKEAEAEKLMRQQNPSDSYEFFGWFLSRRGEDQFRHALETTGKDKLPQPAKPGDDKADALPVPKMPPVAAPPPVVAPPSDERPLPPVAIVPLQPQAIHLGSMRPQWLTAPDGSEMLVLVRTAKIDNKTVYQGVILDWAKLQDALKNEVKDLFPDAVLVPVKDPDGVSPDRAMTALPVQLDVGPEPTLPPAGWTPLRIGILMAWVAAIIAFVAVGFSGWSLIDLAERRIRFVSAVTHELRTPLTSLRLYLDLLVSGMIQDEAKKQEYLNTLALESDRLHRLIDNVLDFAKLEKRRKNGDIKPVKVCELFEQLRATWTDRVAQDGKELVVISTLPTERAVRTDSAMIQQIVGNLIDNARKYTRDAADNRIWLWVKPGSGDIVLIEVEDRGPGVPANERRSIFKPFRRGEQAESTAGGAGLGLALAKSWAEVLGAKLSYRPADGGTGACFRVEMPGK